MSKVDKYLREGEKVLAEASIDKDYIDDRPLGWLYCKVVLCVMIALTLFTCLYIFVENPKMTAKGMPFNSSFFLIGHYFCGVILCILCGVSAAQRIGGFFYNSDNEADENKNAPLSTLDFSETYYSSYYIHWLIFAFIYGTFTFFVFWIVSDVTALHISFQDWIIRTFENAPGFLIMISALGLASLGYVVFMIVSPFYRRRQDIVYYVTTQRFMMINYRTETIKYMELNRRFNIYVKDQIKYVLLRYRYAMPEYKPGEVYQIVVKGITFPGKLLQTLADQNAIVCGIVK